MKNKLTTTILMTAIVLSFLVARGSQSGAVKAVQAAAESAKGPAGSSAVPQVPAIQDTLLMEGWNTLRGMHEQIEVGNGMVVSGESLARFLLVSQIPVVWGSDHICGGGSCSHMYCAPDGTCSYEDGQPGIDPIYINASASQQTSGKAVRVAKELAHEIFHRMRPFGTGPITQFEEFWAFYVDSKISGSAWPVFDGTDPLNPDQLHHWFSAPAMQGYLALNPYPNTFAQSAQSAALQPASVQ